jgi:hypothetical protein
MRYVGKHLAGILGPAVVAGCGGAVDGDGGGPDRAPGLERAAGTHR